MSTEQREIIFKSQLIKKVYPQIVVNENDFTMDSDVETLNEKYSLHKGQVERVLEEDRMKLVKATKEFEQTLRNVDKDELKKMLDLYNSIPEGKPDVDGTVDLINRIPDEEDFKLVKDTVKDFMNSTSNQEHFKDLMNRTLRDSLKSTMAHVSRILDETRERDQDHI